MIDEIESLTRENVSLSSGTASVFEERAWLVKEFLGDATIESPYVILRFHEALNILFLQDVLSQALQKLFHHDVTATHKIFNSLNLEVVENDRCLLDRDHFKKFLEINELDLYRAVAIKESANSYLFTFSLNPIFGDWMSLMVLTEKIIDLYEASKKIKYPENPSVSDVVHKYQELVSPNKKLQQLDFWRERLNNLPPLINFPTDKPRSSKRCHTPGEYVFCVSGDIEDKLKQFTRVNQYSLFEILFTAFLILIYRYTSQKDIPIGTIVNTRNENFENTFGQFDNLIILRASLNGDISGIELIEKIEQINEESRKNRNIAFERLTTTLQKEIGSNNLSLFQMMFDLKHFEHSISEKCKNNDISIVEAKTYSKSDICIFDIKFNFFDFKDSLNGTIQYNSELFEQATIFTIVEHYKNLLEMLVSFPDRKIKRLDFLTKDEVKTQLLTWNETDEPLDDLYVHNLFERKAREAPDLIALIFGNIHVSYRELNARAGLLAEHLRKDDFQKGTYVGLYLDRSINFVVGILAVLKSGGVYAPIDIAYPDARIESILKNTGIKFILTERSLLPKIKSNRSFGSCDLVVINKDVNYNSPIAFGKQNTVQFSVFRSEFDKAYLIHTSGSTGLPKGIEGSHVSIANRIQWCNREFPINLDEVFCLFSNISFVDHVAELFQAICFGLPLVIFPEQEFYSKADIFKVIQNRKITRITVLPSFLRDMVDNFERYRFLSLKYVFSSGEPLEIKHAQKFLTLYNGVRLINVYGATEVGADVSKFEVTKLKYNEISLYFSLKNRGLDKFSTDLVQLHQIENNKNILITAPNTRLDDLKNKYLDTIVPENPTTLEGYNLFLYENVLPYLVNVSSKHFIGHMTSALPNFMPELGKLVVKLNQNMVKVETSKALTFLERQVVAMFHRLFYNSYNYDSVCQDPNSIFGVVTSGGSSANIVGLLAARNQQIVKNGISVAFLKKYGFNHALTKCGFTDSVIICSRLAHYSIKKAISIFGLGENNIIYIDQDPISQKVNLDSLEKIVRKCIDRNQLIIGMVAVAGATETGTIDPIFEMSCIADKYDLHLHVDAAWGGAFILSDKYSHKLEGIEKADSITFCAHKQLFVPQGISLCLFKDKSYAQAISVHAEYQSKEGSFDLGQYTIEGSRPANTILLHAVMHLIAKKGFTQIIEKCMSNTEYLANLIRESEIFELIGEPDLNIINYRYLPKVLRQKGKRSYSSDENLQISEATTVIQKQQFIAGKTFVSLTTLTHETYSTDKISVFRVVLLNPLTSKQDLLDVIADQIDIANRYVESEPNAENIFSGPGLEDNFDLNDALFSTIPIGKPIDNVKMYILDPEMNLLPIGATGEIYISGSSLATGYLNQEQLTNNAFLNHPFIPEKKIYKTGDLGRFRSDGTIEYLGRNDQQLKVNGARIDVREIESSLNNLKGIRNCVIVSSTGKSGRTLIAFIELSSNYQYISNNQIQNILRSHLAEELPVYYMPQNIIIVDQMPLRPNGKVDLKKLQLLSLESGPKVIAGPVGHIEEKLAALWKKYLNISMVSRFDSFYDLGGSSFLAIFIATAIEKAYSIKLSKHIFLEHYCLRDLARIIEELVELKDIA